MAEVAIKEDVDLTALDHLRASGGTNQKGEGSSTSSAAAGTPLIIPIVCRTCGKTDDHWTNMCPYSNFSWQFTRAQQSVRVSNISKDTQEQWLHDLFGPFSREPVTISKDHMKSRGFGFFVYFTSILDAKRAASKLDGYVYDNHNILKVEWPAPRRTMVEDLKAIGGCVPSSPGRQHVINVACDTCGKKGDHWDSFCPYRDLTEEEYALNAHNPTPWVEILVKVSNLSEDTREQELRDLFSPFGQLRRVHITVGKKADISGFGFVEFVSKEDGERAIHKLDGYCYDKHILKVEWVAPKFVGIFWNQPNEYHLA